MTIPLASKKREVPMFVKKLCFGKLSKILLFTTNEERFSNNNVKNKNSNSRTNAAFALDNLLNHAQQVNKNDSQNFVIGAIFGSNQTRTENRFMNKSDERSAKLLRPENDEMSRYQKLFLQNLGTIIKILHESSEEKNIDDWGNVIIVLDRALFLFFVLSLTVSAGIILLQVPKIRL